MRSRVGRGNLPLALRSRKRRQTTLTPIGRLTFPTAQEVLRDVAGRVAQLVRALVSHTRGPGFESLRDHSTADGGPEEKKTGASGCRWRARLSFVVE